MRYLVVFTLLTLFQASGPIPRKAANNPGHNGQDKQAQATGEKEESKDPSVGEGRVEPKIPTSDGSEHAPKNEKETVPMRVAPVDVNKDWADYLYIIANLLLTLITGGIAVFALKQANAAKRSADAYEKTVRLTERADVLLQAAGIRNAFEGRFDTTAESR